MSVSQALIVDDDRSWQSILQEILEDAGLGVEVTDNLDDAVDHLRTTPYRVAVVDLSLAGSDHRNQDGLKVLDAIREHAPGCRSILLTGFATVELAVNALTERGAFTCLHKENFSRVALRDVIDQALATAPSTDTSVHQKSQLPPVEQDDSFTGSVLVVDDDAGWRSILGELLDEAGYQVQPCNSYGEALGALGRGQYRFAVVDLSLAAHPHDDFEGFRLLERLGAEDVPAIVVSGVASAAEIERIYEHYEVFAHLEKQTFDRGAFLRTLEALQAHNASGIDELTPRELETLELLTQGMTNKEIAETLMISPNTVKRHLKAIFTKLDVNTRAAAVAKAAAVGMNVS